MVQVHRLAILIAWMLAMLGGSSVLLGNESPADPVPPDQAQSVSQAAGTSRSLGFQPGTSHIQPSSEPQSTGTGVVEVWGAVLPIDEVDLSPRIEGTLASMHVEPGVIVSKQDRLFSLESDELAARLALAEQELEKVTAISDDHSAVAASKAQLAKIRATLDAVLQLDHQTPLELFRLRMDLAEREAALNAAIAREAQDQVEVAIKREQVRLARIHYESAFVTAPMDGVISEVLKSPGEMVRPGETILKLTRMDKLYIRVELDMQTVPPQRLADYQPLASFASPGVVESPVALRIPISIGNISPTNLDSQHYHALGKIENRRVQDRDGNWHWIIRPGMVGKVELQPSLD